MTDLILRFILFSGIFFTFYKLIFSRMSFFQMNRWILIAIPILALGIPWWASFYENPLVGNGAALVLPEVFLDDEISENLTTEKDTLSWSILFFILYAIGLFSSLFFTYSGILKCRSILKQSESAKNGIFFSKKISSPFTFFDKIALPLSLKNSINLNTIIEHEKVHVSQKHSWDNLYYQLWKAVFWFNPFLYFLNNELRQTHEAIADQAALQLSTKENYAKLLLGSALGNPPSGWQPMAATANPFFNSSLIKNRITMIYKGKSPRKLQWLYLLFVPLLAGMTAVSCSKAKPISTQEKATETEQNAEAFPINEADQMPLFAWCDENASKEEQMECFQKGVLNHVKENFKYPKSAKNLKAEGRILTRFVIGKDGKIRDAQVLRGLPTDTEDDAKNAAGQEANEEAINLVNTLPNLTPARKNGQEIAVSFVLPIMMRLPKEEDAE